MDAPRTKKRAVQYRGPSTSDDYNQRIEENYDDLLILYNRSRLADVEVDELLRRMFKDHLSITHEIDALEARVETLENADTRFTFYSESQLDTDRFDGTSYEVDVEERLTFHPTYGILTLPKVEQASISKFVYTDNDGEEQVPPGLETNIDQLISSADNATATIDSSDVTFALFRKPGVIWERNVVVDATNGNGAQLDVYLKVPLELSTTAKSNALLIHPFPTFGVTIKDISYTTTVDPLLRASDGYVTFNSAEHYSGEDDAVGWVMPGGWTGGNQDADWIVDAGPRLFYFSPKDITAIRITLHQDDYYREGSEYTYTYGLSRLDLRYDKFLTTGRAMVKIADSVLSVDSVTPELYNVSPANINDVFSYRILSEASPGGSIVEGLTSGQAAWIEITLEEDENWTPALSGLIVDYT